MCHGANSSSPTSLISLFVFLPLATARISSKHLPADLLDRHPGSESPRRRCHVASIRWYSVVFVATLMHGAGLQPYTLPRPW